MEVLDFHTSIFPDLRGLVTPLPPSQASADLKESQKNSPVSYKENLRTISQIMINDLIIVGNGPSLIGAGLGEKIDSFKKVVRFNTFKTVGFEHDVGRKTNIWSRWYSVPPHECAEWVDEIWINAPLQDRGKEKWDQSMKNIEPFQGKAKLIPEERVLHDLLAAINIDNKLVWPSSGINAIAHALAEGYKVTIVGIDSWSSAQEHYYEEPRSFNVNHDARKEAAQVKSWLCKGLISLLDKQASN